MTDPQYRALQALQHGPHKPSGMGTAIGLPAPVAGRVLLALYRRKLVLMLDDGRYALSMRGRDRLRREEQCRSATAAAS